MAGEQTRFKPGNTGKPKGAVSKVTADVRETVKAVLAGISADELRNRMSRLEPKDFVDAYAKLAEFVVPKLARTVLAADDAGDGRVSVTLNLGGPPKDAA